MKNINRFIFIVICYATLPSITFATTITMDFEGLPIAHGNNATSTAAYTESGLTMDLDFLSFAHYDMFTTHATLSPGVGKNVVIHEGNNGSKVNFTFAGSATFDLLSVDVIGWFFGHAPIVTSTTVTATSSSGASQTLNALAGSPNFTGVWDFSSIAGFTNISSFTLSMPNPGTACLVTVNNCPNFAFDNVVVQSLSAALPVPEPMTLPLIGLGLFSMGWRRLKKA